MTMEKREPPEINFDAAPGVTLQHPGKIALEILRA